MFPALADLTDKADLANLADSVIPVISLIFIEKKNPLGAPAPSASGHLRCSISFMVVLALDSLYEVSDEILYLYMWTFVSP